MQCVPVTSLFSTMWSLAPPAVEDVVLGRGLGGDHPEEGDPGPQLPLVHPAVILHLGVLMLCRALSAVEAGQDSWI